MKLSEWAEREVKICESKKVNDYDLSCMQSALKAFKSLCEDGHSGYSIQRTMMYLNRFINCKPLTPIEEKDFEGAEQHTGETHKWFQCPRMSSFFKNVYKDGTVKYSDNSRVNVIYEGSDVMWHNGCAKDIVDEMFPIQMPYMPKGKPYIVHGQEYLSDEKNGDYDTQAFLSIELPSGESVAIERYFYNGEPIDKATFEGLVAKHYARLAAKEKEATKE